MLEHKMMLPNANFESMNLKIEEREKLRVLQSATFWPCDTQRRVCVTNYGEHEQVSEMLDANECRIWWQ